MSTTTLYRYEGINATGGHVLLPVNGGRTLVLGDDPGLPPPPPSWEAAVATRDIVQVVNWYETYTGHDGINPYDPDDLPIAEEDLIWVAGGLKSTHDGQVFEGLASNHIRIAHNNVTVRRCRIVGGTGQGYGSYFNPTFGSTYHNTVIEFCTFEGNMTTSGNSAMLLSKTTDRRAVLFRHNESFNFQSMMRGESWVEIEYNYYHDAYHPPGVHSNGIRVIGGGARARRNLITDGTSGGMNMYINDTHGDVWDAQYVENIIGGTVHMPGGRVISPEASASYAFTIGGDRGHLSHGIRIVGNMLYEGLQYGPFSGSGVRWGEDGNYRYDNVWFADGVAPNGQPVQAGQPAMTENRPPEH